MDWLIIVIAIVFCIVGLACVLSVIFGLPGTWIMLGLALLIEFLDRYYLPPGDRQTFSWWLLGLCTLLAGIGELLEFFAGMLGAKQAGSSKRGIWGSFFGGLIGALVGLAVPPPVIGSLICGVVGTFLGAILGEISNEDVLVRDALKPAAGASIGRILGTLSKMPVAMAVWLLLSVAAFWR